MQKWWILLLIAATIPLLSMEKEQLLPKATSRGLAPLRNRATITAAFQTPPAIPKNAALTASQRLRSSRLFLQQRRRYTIGTSALALDEAKRILNIALQFSQEPEPEDHAIIQELRKRLIEEKGASQDIIINRAIEHFHQTFKMARKERRTTRLLSKATAYKPVKPRESVKQQSPEKVAAKQAEQEDIKAVRPLLLAPVVKTSSNEVIQLVLNEYKRREAEKIQFLVHAASGKCSKLQEAMGLNINLRDFKGNTGLALAVEEGRFHAVKLLIDSGSPINTYNDAGETPLDQSNTRLTK